MATRRTRRSTRRGGRPPSVGRHRNPTRGAPGRGLDITEHWTMLRRVFYARFAERCTAAGLEPDDVFAEFVASLHRRNQGKNPYDPRRGGASTYAYIVASSVVSNQVDKASRRHHVVLGTDMDLGLALAHEADPQPGRTR